MLKEIQTARLSEERKREYSRGRVQWWQRILMLLSGYVVVLKDLDC